VNKQRSHRFQVESFDLKQPDKIVGVLRSQIWFAALEKLVAEVDFNSAWEMIRENIKGLGYYKLKKHKQCFVEQCSKLLVQRKQAKLQWLVYASEINGDNMNKTRLEANANYRLFNFALEYIIRKVLVI
jgi:hypothetical protein